MKLPELLATAAPLALVGWLGATSPALRGPHGNGGSGGNEGEGWEPWRFGHDERYELTMTDHSRADAKPVGVVIDLRPGPAADGGEELVTVSYTTTVAVPASELGPQTAFGGAAGGLGFGMLMMNPMMTGFLSQVTLEVGEKMSLFGAGRVEVTGREEIAGVEGFVCKYFNPKEQGGTVVAECVVHPDLAIPLRSVSYTPQGKKTLEVVMTRYEKR